MAGILLGTVALILLQGAVSSSAAPLPFALVKASNEAEELAMRGISLGTWMLSGVLAAGFGASWAQTPAPSSGTTAQAPSPAAAAAKRRAAARRKAAAQAKQSGAALQTIPMESAPPSPPTPPAVEAQQKAQDQHLLQQQEQQSAQAAQITNQQVQQAQKQKDAIQNEVRIQDAPGPAQTGVVPAAGPPLPPANSNDRIQDAPGPAQTLPQMPSTTPGQSAPTTQPAAPPQ
jgi:hypothetical protein